MQMSRSVSIPIARLDSRSTTGTAPQLRRHMIIAAAARSSPGSQLSTSVVISSCTFMTTSPPCVFAPVVV
jgi:hypothetical protein